MIQLSERVKLLKTSATLAITAKARELKAQGENVISFSIGEPDFATPEHIVESACQALRQGKTHYENTAGTPESRQAVASYFNKRFGRHISADNVILSTGGKNGLYIAFQALVNPGDEVIVPAPYWVTYPEQAKLAGASVKVIPGLVENNFKVTPEQLEAAITEKSRVFVLCSPSNPSGATYSKDELEKLAAVILKHPNLLVFSDEMYERLIYGDITFTSFASLSPEVEERTITFNGVSKAYAMTGWRVGFTVAPVEVIKAMTKLQGQMTSNITSFNMPAVVTALEGSQKTVEDMCAEFAKRAAYVYECVKAIPEVICPEPKATFYVFPDISKAVFGKSTPDGQLIDSAQTFAQALLEKEKVALVPGEAFGSPNNIRISFACSMEQIKEGMERITRFIASLK